LSISEVPLTTTYALWWEEASKEGGPSRGERGDAKEKIKVSGT
jgi:hypothetical protein